MTVFRPLVPFLAVGLVLALATSARSQFAIDSRAALIQLSADPYTNGGGAEHATELESHTVAFGSMIVAAFQTGRFPDGGSTDIGWATSSDSGATWKFGFLPSLTSNSNPAGPYQRISDPALAYDAAHGLWLISSLPVTSGSAPAVVVSASDDGLNWGAPVSVAPAPIGSDKNWITCDNTPTSPFFGQCYVEWDDGNNQVQMNVSKDGGKTWGPSVPGGSNAVGLGGQPLAQPNGTVIVPFAGDNGSILDIVSANGGKTWSNAFTVSPEADHQVAQMRAPSLPSAQMDAAGTVYVMWHDCSFRASCASNDIVLSTSTDGQHWTAKARVPIDPTTSTVDHFTPGIGVDPATTGANAHLGLIYNYFPVAKCSVTTCRLHTGFITSHNGGQTWSSPKRLTKAVQLPWLANAGGYFVGDYVATAFTQDGLAHSVFALGQPGAKGILNEGAVTTAAGLPVNMRGPEFSSRFERPYPNAHSDHRREHLPPKKKLTKKVLDSD